MIAIEARFDRPVMADALAELEEELGPAQVADESAALFVSRSTNFDGRAFARVCTRVRSLLNVAVHPEGSVVELDNVTAYRAVAGSWQRIRPS